MNLRPDQSLRWEKVSDRELRVTIEAGEKGPMAALGYLRSLGLLYRSTDDWIKELREGEEPDVGDC